MKRFVYAYDPDNNNVYLYEVEVQQSPLEPGVWLDQIPFTTPKLPLDDKVGFTVNFINDEWEYVEIPQEQVED